MLQLVPSAMILLFLSLVLGVLLGAGWFVYGVARGIPYWRAGLPLACALAVYGVLLLAGSATSSERHVPLGSSLCFDDWCVSVTGVQQASAAGSERTVTADVRVFSEAKRVTQRGSGPRIFLIDDRRRWFEAMPSPGDTPLDTTLGPGEAFATRVHARVPAGTRIVAVRVWEGGWLDRLVPFDEESPFHGKTFYEV